MAASDPPEGGGSPQTERPVMGNQAFVIPPAEIARLQENALKGSGEAAYKLAQFHNMVTLDFKEGLYWMTISAENGFQNALYGVGFYLRLQDDPRSNLRARYWLERAVKEAPEPAAGLARRRLEEMDKASK